MIKYLIFAILLFLAGCNTTVNCQGNQSCSNHGDLGIETPDPDNVNIGPVNIAGPTRYLAESTIVTPDDNVLIHVERERPYHLYRVYLHDDIEGVIIGMSNGISDLQPDRETLLDIDNFIERHLNNPDILDGNMVHSQNAGQSRLTFNSIGTKFDGFPNTITGNWEYNGRFQTTSFCYGCDNITIGGDMQMTLNFNEGKVIFGQDANTQTDTTIIGEGRFNTEGWISAEQLTLIFGAHQATDPRNLDQYHLIYRDNQTSYRNTYIDLEGSLHGDGQISTGMFLSDSRGNGSPVEWWGHFLAHKE